MSARPKTSYTELSTLAECEQKWALKYLGERPLIVPSDAAKKGTMLHAATGAFWKGENVREALVRSAVELDVLEVGGRYPEEGLWPDTEWLVDRYVRHYREMTRNVKVHSQEVRLAAKVPGTRVRLGGAVDEVWEINGKLWLVERKSMRDWRRLQLLEVDPQLTVYYWLARESGLDIYGIVFDAIRTYRYSAQKPTQAQVLETAPADILARTKAGQREWAREAVERHPGVERPDYESFQMLWLDRTDEQVEVALREWALPAIKRRASLARGMTPIRNISQMSCPGCPFKEPCYEGLAFPFPEIEVDEDE